MSWRGAALPVGSSIGLLAGGSQKRLLAQSQPNACLIRDWTPRSVRTVMDYRSRAGSFPGAACYQLIDLPTYQAAPLQAMRAALAPCYLLIPILNLSNLPRVQKMNGIAGITRTRHLFA
jgi:hypothetical protein